MKTIRVKSYNKLIENIINEDSIKLDGNTNDYKGKLKKRITDAIRLAKECKIAAKKARDDGNDVDAEWLEKRAEDYEDAAKTWNQDALDDEEDNSADSKDKEPSQSEAAQDAANAAKRAARDAQDAANEAQNNAKKLADAGHDASAAQAAADKAQEKANEAKKAVSCSELKDNQEVLKVFKETFFKKDELTFDEVKSLFENKKEGFGWMFNSKGVRNMLEKHNI